MSENLESKYTFIWSIENFSLSSQPFSERISSPVFLVEILDCAQFYLSVYPRGKTQDGFIYCDFSRADDDSGPEVVEFEFSLSIKAENDLKETINRSCKAKRKSNLNSGLEKEIKILFEKSEEFLPNDILTFQCCLIPKLSEIKSSKKCYANTLIHLEKHSFVLPWISTEFSTSTTTHTPPNDCFFNVPLQCHSKHGRFELEISNCLDLNKEGRIKIRRTAADGSEKKLFLVFKAFLEDIDEIVCCERVVEAENSEWEVVFFTNKSLLAPGSRGDVFPVRWDFAISDGSYTTISIRIIHDSLEELGDWDSHFGLGTTKLKIWKEIYGDKKFCDVTLKVENTNFPAHKCVLSASSPVFSSMLESDMKEKETGTVEIIDMTKETLQQLLSFVYTGAVTDLQHNNAVKLYVAADKYQILQLKQFCSSFLKANMTVGNVCDVLDIANLCEDTDLERKAKSYISSRSNYIFTSNEWKNFMGKRLQFAADIMLDLCKKFKNSL